MLANELRVLDDLSRRKLFHRRCPRKHSRHFVRAPYSEQDLIEDTWEESTDTWERLIQASLRKRKAQVCCVWSGSKYRRSLEQHGKTVFRKRVSTIPSASSQSSVVKGGLNVFVSFDLNSERDTLVFAMHSESFVAQPAQKGHTEVSTKHLNFEELTALAEQTKVQNWVRNSVVEAASKKGTPTRS